MWRIISRYFTRAEKLCQAVPPVVWVTVICLFALIVHAPLLWGYFTNYDDGGQITQFEDVTKQDPSVLKEMLTTNYERKNSNPMYISFFLNWYLTPASYLGFVVFNLLWLMLTIVIFFRFSRLFLATSKWQLWSTALFAVHCINADIVAWISARCHFGGMPFLLLAFITWDKYLSSVPLKQKALWYGVSILCCAAAVINKTSFVVAVPMLLFFDFYRRRRFSISILLDKVVPAAVIARLVMIPGKVTNFADGALKKESFADQIVNQLPMAIGELGQYFYSLFVPGPTVISVGATMPQVEYYFGIPPQSEVMITNFMPITSLAFLLLLFLASILIWKKYREPLPLLAFLCIGLALGPVLGFVKWAVAFGFRYLWIPTVFFSLAVVSVVRLVHVHFHRWGRPLAVAVLGLYIGWHAVVCFRQCAAYDTTAKYWEYSLSHFPNCKMCAYKLGRAQFEAHPMAAVKAYWIEQEIETCGKNDHRNKGIRLPRALKAMGEDQKAALFYERALIWDNLGAGRRKEARKFLEKHPITEETRQAFEKARSPWGW
ncbi:MAG: hypothetical protein JXR76_14370 [Deltaproteobacteria bacterium]|nr:hypothetical protein [Deltaproteobacteria bacterium]